jgi:hypothetical protein
MTVILSTSSICDFVIAVSFILEKYSLLTNLCTTYWPTAKTRIIKVNNAISVNEDLNPPTEDAIPTIELSTITAMTIKIITIKMLLPPNLIIGQRHQCEKGLDMMGINPMISLDSMCNIKHLYNKLGNTIPGEDTLLLEV